MKLVRGLLDVPLDVRVVPRALCARKRILLGELAVVVLLGPRTPLGPHSCVLQGPVHHLDVRRIVLIGHLVEHVPEVRALARLLEHHHGRDHADDKGKRFRTRLVGLRVDDRENAAKASTLQEVLANNDHHVIEDGNAQVLELLVFDDRRDVFAMPAPRVMHIDDLLPRMQLLAVHLVQPCVLAANPDERYRHAFRHGGTDGRARGHAAHMHGLRARMYIGRTITR